MAFKVGKQKQKNYDLLVGETSDVGAEVHCLRLHYDIHRVSLIES